jgi:hypothetical protein
MSHVDDGQLNALLDGELEPGDAKAIEAHLASCAVCAKRLEEAKQFLAESASLLDVLVPPERPAVRPEAALPATGVMSAAPGAPPAPAAAGGPEHRPSKTAKEIALDIDGSTQKSPAIRPLFPREAERRAAAVDESPKVTLKRRVDWSQLAWAATVVLAMGVTWMLNELKHTGGAPAGATQVAVSDGAPPVAPPREPATGPAAGAAEHRRPASPALRPVATKPPNARGNKPLTPENAADAISLDRPGAVAARSLAGRDLATQDRLNPAGGAGVASAQPMAPAAQQPSPPARLGPSPGPGRAAEGNLGARPLAAPPAAGAGASPRPSPAAPAPTAEVLSRVSRRDTAREEVLTTFRRISLDQAARRLSGAIRLIDGRPWDHVEVGPGRLVPGSDRLRDVVRVFYFDDQGRPLILDQQRIPVRADTSAELRAGPVEALDMAPGDTLVTTAPSGLTRIRWLDRKFFWLSLSGNMPADSLRMLVLRVR